VRPGGGWQGRRGEDRQRQASSDEQPESSHVRGSIIGTHVLALNADSSNEVTA